MLASPAPFPYAGSNGFVVGTAEPCRIISRSRDGTCLVKLTARSRTVSDAASGNRRFNMAELAETADAAMGKLRKSRRRSAR